MLVTQIPKSIKTKITTGSFLPTLTLILMIISISANAATYYWVGGSGNWTDLNHWSNVSGGPAHYTQVPTINDDVIFDENSFTAPGQVVYINTPNASCHNLDFRDVKFNPTVKKGGASPNLRIFGSLWLSSEMIFDFDRPITFEATQSGQVIQTANHLIKSEITFSGSGAWTLLDSLKAQNIYFSEGTLITNGQFLSIHGFYSNTHKSANINIANSTIYVDHWSVSSSVVNLTASNSTLFVSDKFVGELSDQYNNGIFTGRVKMNNGQFKKAIFYNGAKWSGDQAIDTAILKPGGSFMFHQNSQLEIGDSLSINGTCDSLITLWTEQAKIKGTLIKNGGSVNGKWVIIRDIEGQGSSTFNLTNSTDLGRNTGWNISGGSSKTLYWVNGTGNWLDNSHWSTTSGGPAGACIPRPTDNVIFDDNSFTSSKDTVYIKTYNAHCKTMDWRQVSASHFPKLDLQHEHYLNVYGSLYLSPNLHLSNRGALRSFDIQQNREILSAGVEFFPDWIMDGNYGSWKLLDSLKAFEIYQYWGDWYTNDQYVRFYRFRSMGGKQRYVNLGNSTIEVLGTNYAWWVHSPWLTQDPGSSHVYFKTPGAVLWAAGPLLPFNYVEFTAETGLSSINSIKAKHVKIGNDGEFYQTNEFDTLSLSSNHTYTIRPSQKLFINDILYSVGSCTAPVFFKSGSPGTESFLIDSNGTIDVYNTTIKDIHAQGGADFNAYSSVDLGNNDGWNFVQSDSMDLYWVNGSGNWSDSTHWDTLSGGPGGACVPTANNNVIFDQNSFTDSDDTVHINISDAFCNDMTWKKVAGRPKLYGTSYDRKIHVYGSLTFSDSVINQYKGVFEFESGDMNEVIKTANLGFPGKVILNGTGKWKLYDSLKVSEILRHNYGTFDATNSNMILQNYESLGSVERALYMDSANITIHATWKVSSTNFSLSSKYSKITYPSRGRLENYGNDTLQYYNVYFYGLHHPSWLRQGSYNHVYFGNDGIIQGDTQFDTLSFSPGNLYELQANREQTIREQLNAIGVGCYPIIIRSQTKGSPAFIRKESGLIQTEYVEYRDIHVKGGVKYEAGFFSVDAGNNQGLIFGTGGKIFDRVLGPDSTICAGETYQLTSGYYLQNVQRLWGDSSTVITKSIDSAGTYMVALNFAQGCYLSDTVNIDFTNTQIELGTDTSLCEGQSLTIQPSLDPAWQTQWHDNSTGTEVSVTDDATVWLKVTDTFNCSDTDSIDVLFWPPPKPDLGNDTAICSYDSLLLQPSIPKGAQVTWQNGATDTFLFAKPGNHYNVEVAINEKCKGQDSIYIDSIMPPRFDLGADTFICTDESLSIGLDNANLTYQWSTGDTGQSIDINKAGHYSLTTTNATGCYGTDSIFINKYEKSALEIPDTSWCFDDEPVYVIHAPEGMGAYYWNGEVGSDSLMVKDFGQIELMIADSNQCRVTTIITINNNCETNIQLPNAFSPNGDGVNDRFIIKSKNIVEGHLQIYSRWGKLVFKTNNLAVGWDGTHGGIDMPIGVYVFQLNATDANGKTFHKQGQVTLIR